MLSELIARVEAATEGSRELDALIAVAVDGFFIDGEDPWGRPKYCYLDEDGAQISPGQGHDMLVRRYTTSVDAALALIERVLRGAVWRVGFDPDDGSIRAEIVGAAPDCVRSTANHDSPALALCAAALRALQAKQTGADHA